MKKRGIICFTLFVLVVVVDILLINFNLKNKFKNVTIELGTESVLKEEFLVSKFYEKNSKLLTDISTIDLSEVGEYDVELSFGGYKETVKLIVVDTVAPEVVYVDLNKGLDYKFDANDFVSLVKDKSYYTVTSETEITELEPKDYQVDIAVTDEFGNKTVSTRNLHIGVFNSEINHELGETLTKEEILISPSFGEEALTKQTLSTIDINKEGEYNLNITYKDKEYISKIIVKDTKGPKIVVNNIDFFLGDTPKKNEDFVKSVTDPSGVKKVTYEGKLDYNKIGQYDLKITATDNLGHQTVETAVLKVKDDNVGPVFKGLKNITAKKNQEIDFYAGVTAKDAKDGVREFTVDTSKVDTKKAGTYYAYYTSSDSSNNVTTKKRKIVISYDMSDMDELVRQYYNKYLSGKSVLEMTKYIKSHTGYSHTYGTDDDALYQILTTKSGSCRGHAFLLQKVLDIAGVENMIIKTIDETHYWNLVKINGVWRHYDSTPGSHIAGPATDEQKLSSAGMRGRKWDTSKYPKAE